MSFTSEHLLSVLGRAYADGLRFAEIAEELGVRKPEQNRLRKMLTTMMDDGRIARIERGRYAVVPSVDNPLAIGRITVHPAGYGFVQAEGLAKDIFVPAKFRGAALDGDEVALYTWEGYKGTEGRVEEVISRGRAKLTGTLRRAGRSVFLEPDDPRIASTYGHIVLDGGTQGGKVGQAVVVEISQYPSDDVPEIVGRVSRILGDPEDPRTEIAKIIACADIPDEFPNAAVAQAKATSQELTDADKADRIDLRDRPFMTIDPETARDFDDAMCIEPLPEGNLRVWVAVADVSHYVRPDDALDREASIRGVSVYLPDQVIPMLPFELSSGICSLNPEVDRCAMVVRMDYTATGELIGTGYAAAVINSHARLDYPGVAAALQGDFRGKRAHYRQWAPALTQLADLSQKLRAKRMARGSLDLELPEPKVILDADDPLLVRDVVRAKGSEDIKRAYQLVEEYMVAANEAVGAFFRQRDLATVWRRHDPPKRERLEELAQILESYGVKLESSSALNPNGLKAVVKKVSELPAGKSLTFLVLRSLKQAAYDVESEGHFGLASPDYLHFTSPIRRYPDLLVHRLLKYYLHQEGQASAGGGSLNPPPRGKLQELAVASSTNERRAMEAEREAVSMYRAYLVREQLGEVFSARVSGITNFGVFVEIETPYVEGLIRIEDLGEPMEFDPLRVRMSGKVTGLSLILGDTVEVKLINVSVARRRIDFALLSGGVERGRPAKANRRPDTRKRPARTTKQARSRDSATRGKGGKVTRGKGGKLTKSGRPSKGTKRSAASKGKGKGKGKSGPGKGKGGPRKGRRR